LLEKSKSIKLKEEKEKIMKQMKEEDIKREKERRVEEERLKLNKAKTKKKNWFMDSYHSLKRKLIQRPIIEAEDIIPVEEEVEEEIFTVFDGKGDPAPEIDEEEQLPEWLKGREAVEDELENAICEPEYLVKDMYRG
jgi:hypothetical protein